MQNSIGSQWNKWDLHLHTASSFDYQYKADDSDARLCKQLIDNNVKAVAITDHWKIDAERIKNLRLKAPDILFFPGVELRTDKGSKNLHIILIFSDQIPLRELSEDFEAIMMRQKAKSKDSDKTIYWTFEDIINFANEHNALVSIHAGKKENGIDKEIKNESPFNMAIKEDIADYVDFFEIGKRSDIKGYNEHVFKEIKRKPLIICSDNHNPNDYTVKEKLWIKGDLTFEGLRQCLHQPLERVFIGDVPPVLDRLNKNLQKNIATVSVRRVENPLNTDKTWFDFELPLNPGLVSIIGSKGSGKSALADIIAYMCRSNTIQKASFLNDNRFKKAPQYYAKDYEAELTWADGKTVSQNINETNEDSTIEYAQYLPQKHIEEVCNEFGDVFQKEINKVIFSYVDKTERGEASSLKELVELKSYPLDIERESHLSKLRAINKEIIKLEAKKKKSYRKKLEEGLANIEESLKRHDDNKPVEVIKPVSKEGNRKYETELAKYNTKIKELEVEKSSALNEIMDINTFVSEANSVAASIEALHEKYISTQELILNFSDRHNLKLVVPQYNLSQIREVVSQSIDLKEKRKEELYDAVNNKDNGFEVSIKHLKERKEGLIAETDSEEKRYQKYLSDLKLWEEERNRIKGDSSTDGSVEYFKSELKYLDDKIETDYQTAILEREEVVRDLYKNIGKKLTVYQDIYAPVQKEIVTLLGDLEDSITFQAEVLLKDMRVSEKISEFINLRYNGKFGRGHNSVQEIKLLLDRTDFSNEDSVVNLVNEFIEVVTENLEAADNRISNIESFYDFVCKLEYIDVDYRLKMGERNLAELSPGERGILLLVFYLALSKESNPIIIDQPEDNLDNQSVYSKLVPCICRAKQRRQVIIVTHNPNIAVACDAEQIIYCQMDKQDSQITYISGSIENPEIKKHVVDVLEGTMPAFDLRRRKYSYSSN